MASLFQADAGSHDGVGVVGDQVEEFREVCDQDVHRSALKSDEVQLHVHRAHHFLEGHSSHTPYEARGPKGALVDGRRQGVESRWLQL